MRRALLVVLLVGCGGSKSAPGAATATKEDRVADESPNAQPVMPLATPTPGPNEGGPSALPTPGPNAPPGGDATPMPNGGAGLTPSAGAGSVVVIAKITDAGPIGDGKCSQRSYELAVAKTVTGSVPPKLWAHFEQCGPSSAPAAGNLAGTGLSTGTTYQLTLKKSASSNFGDGFMIVDARVP